MGKVGRDDKDLAGVDGARGSIVEVKAECAFGDEGDLLVGVGVAGGQWTVCLQPCSCGSGGVAAAR